jgi:hypothetical protein
MYSSFLAETFHSSLFCCFLSPLTFVTFSYKFFFDDHKANNEDKSSLSESKHLQLSLQFQKCPDRYTER